jgi:hypothetical protein
MRLTRRFKMGERANLQLLAEGFNIFNHVNYASVNSIVGTRPDLTLGMTNFNVSGRAIDPTVTPISTPQVFTSAFPMRQLQLGVRILF